MSDFPRENNMDLCTDFCVVWNEVRFIRFFYRGEVEIKNR